MVLRSVEGSIGHRHDAHALEKYDGPHPAAFLVEQEGRFIHRQLLDDTGGAFLHGLFFDEAQYGQGERFDAADAAFTLAAWTDDLAVFSQRGPQALARHLQQAEARDTADLHARPIFLEVILETENHNTQKTSEGHVDEVVDDQAAEVAQA